MSSLAIMMNLPLDPPRQQYLPSNAHHAYQEEVAEAEEDDDDDHNHNQDENEDTTSNDHHGRESSSRPAPSGTESLTYEKWEKTPRPRGRQAKDPHAEYIRFDCKDIDDLEENLRNYLEAPTAAAEHATIEFHFPVTSAFMVYSRDFKRDPNTPWTSAEPIDLMKRTAVSVIEVLQPTENPREQIIRQKAVARTCVEAVQRADGFRYSFHNNWLSREDKAHRFSFFCNDSTLNKGRAANGGAGSEGRLRRKPVYDCHGLIAVKFSVTKNNLEVHYRHVPVHKTYEERAPPPRRESKRRKLLEILDPETLKKLPQKPKKGEGGDKEPHKWVKYGPHKKNGRPKKRSAPDDEALSSPYDVSTSGQAERDEGLQPLVDFLGSAERATPNVRGQADNEDDGNNNGGTVIPEDDDAPAGIASASLNLPRIAAQKQDQPTPPRPHKIRKLDGPYIPGTMAGSLQSGNITWGTEAPNQDYTQLTAKERKQKEKVEKKREKEIAKLKNKKELTEMEALKKQLLETEQRLQKLEAEKRAPQPASPPPPPPPPYPPYPPPPQYPPQYHYHPPQGYYPLPPNYYPPPPQQPYPAPQWHNYQAPPPAQRPPMYPGSPPHPNSSQRPSQPVPQTPSQPAYARQAAARTSAQPKVANAASPQTQTPAQPPQATSETQATLATAAAPQKADQNAQGMAPEAISPSYEVTAEQTTENHTSASKRALPEAAADLLPAQESTPARLQTESLTITETSVEETQSKPLSAPYEAPNSAQSATADPAQPASNAPALQIPHPTSSRPITAQESTSKAGVLTLGLGKQQLNTEAGLAKHSPISSATSQQPIVGVLKLVDTLIDTGSAPPSAQSAADDARMKGLFDSALAAVSQPTNSAPANFTQPLTPSNMAAKKPAPNPKPVPTLAPAPPNPPHWQWNGPAYAPGWNNPNQFPAHPQSRGWGLLPQGYPPHGYPPYPHYPQHSAHPCPPYGPPQHYQYPPYPAPPPLNLARPPPPPGAHPLPGYDKLRDTMTAHATLNAQQIPTPAIKNQSQPAAPAEDVSLMEGLAEAAASASAEEQSKDKEKEQGKEADTDRAAAEILATKKAIADATAKIQEVAGRAEDVDSDSEMESLVIGKDGKGKEPQSAISAGSSASSETSFASARAAEDENDDDEDEDEETEDADGPSNGQTRVRLGDIDNGRDSDTSEEA